MSVDFFETPCKEDARTDQLFGICDDQENTKAYTDVDDDKKWIATVVNQNEREIAFTAIDNCIEVFKPETEDKESTCDGLLTFTDSIYLVELKKQGTGGWLPKATSQLKNTIRLISEFHDLSGIRFKKAFACNRKHPRFTTIDNQLSKRFYRETNGFRLDAQTKIEIK